MSYEKLFKYIQYYPDGSGRDSYINSNSGGFSRFMPKQLIQGYSSYPRSPVYNFRDLRKTSWAIKYKSDGSGRDTYIISNSGGLSYDWKEGVKFDKTLRTSQYPINKTKYTDLRISKNDFANSLKIKKIQDSVTERLYTANTNSNYRKKRNLFNHEDKQNNNLKESANLNTEISHKNKNNSKLKSADENELRLLTSSDSIRNKNKICFTNNVEVKLKQIEDKKKMKLGNIKYNGFQLDTVNIKNIEDKNFKSKDSNQNLNIQNPYQINDLKIEPTNRNINEKILEPKSNNINDKNVQYQAYYNLITEYNQKSAKNIGKLKIVFPKICNEFK